MMWGWDVHCPRWMSSGTASVLLLGATWETNFKNKMLHFFTLAPHIASIECNKANFEGFVEKYSPEHLHSIV